MERPQTYHWNKKMTSDEIIEKAKDILEKSSCSDEERHYDIKCLLFLLIMSNISTQHKLDNMNVTTLWGPKI